MANITKRSGGITIAGKIIHLKVKLNLLITIVHIYLPTKV
jgi:hypothetical protein